MKHGQRGVTSDGTCATWGSRPGGRSSAPPWSYSGRLRVPVGRWIPDTFDQRRSLRITTTWVGPGVFLVVSAARFGQSVRVLDGPGIGVAWEPCPRVARMGTIPMLDEPAPDLDAETIRRMAAHEVKIVLSPAEVDALSKLLGPLLGEIRQVAPADRAGAEPETSVTVEEWPR